MSKITQNKEDISSYANFDEIIQKEVFIDVSLDFDKKQMLGTMEVKYEILSSEIPNVILDLKGPEIVSVEYVIKNEKNEEKTMIPLTYEIYSESVYKDSLGTPLKITLDNVKKNNPDEYNKLSKSKTLMLCIKFITTENCTGIQFLTKQQNNKPIQKNILLCSPNVKQYNVDLYFQYKIHPLLNQYIKLKLQSHHL